MAHLDIGEAVNGRLRIAFKTEIGNVSCEVSEKTLGPPEKHSDADRRVAALKKAKKLVRAFYEAIPDA